SHAANGLIKTFGHISVGHVFTIPGKTNISRAIYDYQPSGTFSLCSKQSYRSFRCIPRANPTGHKISRAFSNEQARKILTLARTGDCRVLVSIEATSHKRSITHSSRVLIENTSRRSSGSQYARGIDSHRSNRSMPLLTR